MRIYIFKMYFLFHFELKINLFWNKKLRVFMSCVQYCCRPTKYVMRNVLFILTIALLTSCSSKNTIDVEKDIFISALDTGFDTNGKSKLKSSFQAIHFDKDFWNYFLRTHPKTSTMLFIKPLYDTTNNFVSLPDTSFSFYNVNFMTPFFLNNLLADSVVGHEKGGFSFFVVPDDTTGTAAKEKRIKENLKNYKITPTVEREFNQLKSILTQKDTAEHYVIIFKKNVANRIYSLYE